ncbi:MAG: sugar ABC transporter permease [Chloroflexi bacterium]|nr:sugar ABC transporter permease [Chloroflexota bacterium]
MNTNEVMPSPSQKARRIWQQIEPALYIGPAFLVLIIILIYPLGYSFWLSFHEWTLRDFINGVPWVGLQNYVALFTSSDFLNSLRITFTFVGSALAIEFGLGMGLALLLNQSLRGQGIIRSVILLPMMCTNVVVGLTWRLLFNYQFGIINFYISQAGLTPVEWLSVPNLAMLSVVIVDVWNTTSFVALMLLAGLQSLPDEPFEAARIDGASRWQTFIYLTLPLLRQTILVALLWRLIDTFRVFDVVYLLTAGGPARATEMVSIYVYTYGFKSFNLGYASAASYAMILIMIVIAGFLARGIGRSSE